MTEAYIEEILKQIQRQYRIMMETDQFTKELGEAISTNDPVSIQLVLEMRQESLHEMEASRRAVVILIDSMPEEQRGHVKKLLERESEEEPENELERVLKEKCSKVYEVVDGVIKKDRELSLKTAGKDSLYQV